MKRFVVISLLLAVGKDGEVGAGVNPHISRFLVVSGQLAQQEIDYCVYITHIYPAIAGKIGIDVATLAQHHIDDDIDVADV